MAIPKNKSELISAIEDTYSKLKKELEDIPEERAAIIELEGHAKGTMMSVANLVSYLIGWGELVLKWHTKRKKGKKVDFPETGYRWNELGKLAQKFYKDYEAYDYQDLLMKLDAVVNEILKLIKGYSNHYLYDPSWYEKWSLGRMIQFNTSSAYKNARARIRKWRKMKEM